MLYNTKGLEFRDLVIFCNFYTYTKTNEIQKDLLSLPRILKNIVLWHIVLTLTSNLW